MMKKTSRKIVYHIWTILLIALIMGFASCHKNNPDHNGDNPGSGGDNPSIPVVPGDPEGTVTLNINNGASYYGDWYNIGIGMPITIDAANNFVGLNTTTVVFVSVGEVESLGHVTTIPIEGWSSSVAVIPGEGYIARCGNVFARLYVVDYIISTQGGIMGATIKYQSPFLYNMPISLETSSIIFDVNGGTKSVKLTSPASFAIEEKPEWCEVSVDFCNVTVSVMENLLPQQRLGEIVLKNEVGDARLTIIQQFIDPIVLENMTIEFTNEASTQRVGFLYPVNVTVEESPEWCSVEVDSMSVSVSVTANLLPQPRSGEIVLKNEVSNARLTIVQQFIDPIVLESSTIVFMSEASTQSVGFIYPVNATIEESPIWCTAAINPNSITVTVAENFSPQQRSGIIVLTNEVSTVGLRVEQEGFIVPDPNPGGEVQSLPYVQFFSEFGSYMTYDFQGAQSWGINYGYNVAQMTGYVTGCYNVNNDWLISSPVVITGVNDAKITMEYVGRYFGNDNAINDDVTIWVSNNYVWGNNPITATWTHIPATLTESSNWIFQTTEISLSEYIGQTITIAVRYTSDASHAGTIQIKSIAIH